MLPEIRNSSFLVYGSAYADPITPTRSIARE